MISPVGTERTAGSISGTGWGGGMTGMSDARQRSAKCPSFDPTCPLFEHDRPDHDLTAITADRAVLYELIRFLAVIHNIRSPLIQRWPRWRYMRASPGCFAIPSE